MSVCVVINLMSTQTARSFFSTHISPNEIDDVVHITSLSCLRAVHVLLNKSSTFEDVLLHGGAVHLFRSLLKRQSSSVNTCCLLPVCLLLCRSVYVRISAGSPEKEDV